MHYVLIIMWLLNDPMISTVEYDNLAACTVAADQVHNLMMPGKVETVCTAKKVPLEAYQ
jgi:uncharacterized protein YuzB (UPF0349 family)